MNTIAIIPSTIGYHWEEVFDAYVAFNEANWLIDFFTVNGKKPVPDPNSIKKRPLLSFLGMGVRDSFSPDSDLGRELLSVLQHQVQSIDALDLNKIDAIYIPGGHGCLFDVNINPVVHEKLLAAFQKNLLIGAVCHGVSCLAFVKTEHGSIVKNKRMIGFLDSFDNMLMNMGLIDQKFLPLPYLNEKALKDAGAKITGLDKIMATLNPGYTVTDLPFITGVGPKAAKNVAQIMIGHKK